MAELVLGTNNQKKRRELEQLLGPHGLVIRLLGEFSNIQEVDEDGDSFQANAVKKATGYALQTGHWVLADDSGLVVPALDGAPGVHSARYSDPGATDERNNAKLLDELAARREVSRAAYYVAVVALSDPAGTIRAVCEGRCHGVIRQTPLGDGGFGYDPLFEIPELGKTFAQLSPEEKHARSHRGEALRGLLPGLLDAMAPSGGEKI